MTTAVRPDENNWWWVECDCGYRQGPFVCEPDGMDDAEEHADQCVPYPKLKTSEDAAD